MAALIGAPMADTDPPPAGGVTSHGGGSLRLMDHLRAALGAADRRWSSLPGRRGSSSPRGEGSTVPRGRVPLPCSGGASTEVTLIVDTVEQYRVGDLTVDALRGAVRGPDGPVELYPQTLAVLLQLLRVAPEVCRSQDLLDSVWPGRFVGDQNLKQRVHQLRSRLAAFGVDVVTVRRVGYRLGTPVERLTGREGAPPRRGPRAESLIERARSHADGLEHGKAAALLEEVVALEPKWSAPRTLLAWASMWLGRPDDARRHLDEAARISEAEGGVEALIVSATRSSFAGDAFDAVDRLELALEERPDDYWLLINLIGHHWLLRRWDRVDDLLGRLEVVRPGHFLNAWQRGFRQLLLAGDLAEASREFAEVARLAPDLPLPLAELMPALQAWHGGDRSVALAEMDGVLAARRAPLSVIGREMILTFRSRLLADMGEVQAARLDQAQAVALFDEGSASAWYHRLEMALLDAENGRGGAETILRHLSRNASALYRVQALGWTGVIASRRGDAATGRRCAEALAAAVYDGGWEWGYPTRPAFDLVQSVFPLLIGGHIALHSGRSEAALNNFSRARRMAPDCFAIVPVVSLDGRAHLEATEGVALAAASRGNARLAEEADRWLAGNPLKTAILAQAGAGYADRARLRLAQSPKTTSATPIEKSSGPAVPVLPE